MYKFQILQDTFNLMEMLDKEASTLSANYGQKLRWNDNTEPQQLYTLISGAVAPAQESWKYFKA